MSKVNFLIASVLLLVAAVAQAAEAVGKVDYMSGSLVVKRADGTIKIMGTKSEVLAGDMLGTAKDSYAQVQMNDGTKMTLRPNSSLKIDEYRFKEEEPESDNAVFSLLKGGLRTVTGLIGKRGDPDAYKMRAATAVIGIRGTDFSSRLCATQNCQDDMAASAKLADKPQTMPQQPPGDTPPAAPAISPPGLYVAHNGQVVMAQAGMSLNPGRGETGFAGPAAPPPAFMAADTRQTVTGLIGKRGDPDAYKMRAASAQLADKPQTMPQRPPGGTPPAAPAISPPGLYVTVHNGQVVMAQAGMSLNLGRGETGFASPAALIRLPAPPAFMAADTRQTNAMEAMAGSKPDAELGNINPYGRNADSQNPVVNKSGCVVQPAK